MSRQFFVYILASKRNGTLCIGVTNDIARRTTEHQLGIGASFTRKYDVRMLVYFETFDRVIDAIAREKHLKKWRREWKINLIEASNPDWQDLSGPTLPQR